MDKEPGSHNNLDNLSEIYLKLKPSKPLFVYLFFLI